ncbi:MAG: ATP-binding protein [Acidobacteriota bacterium]|nr:ATP-binding protein [Acidobacteriota bacterium]
MNVFRLLNSFRVRLLLVLAALLVGTLGVQFYLNSRAAQRVARIIAAQEQALAAGISLAALTLPTTKRLELFDKERGFNLREKYEGRVTNVLIVKDEGSVPGQLDANDLIDDSLAPEFIPETLDDGTAKYFKVSEARLPRMINADQAEIIARPVAGEPRAFTFSASTSRGLNFIIVVLGSATVPDSQLFWQSFRPLLPTLIVLLLAIFTTGLLVWRFTRPINELSSAARRVAAGDFNFNVPAANRADEMGALAGVFNEMIAQLRRIRELESQLHQVERSAVVGRLASAIAHEIRNPLNYINLTLDHLRTSLAPEDEKRRELVQKLIDQLKSEVARINTRITEFLKFTRPSKLELLPLPLRPLLEDALRLVEAQAAESNIETKLEEHGPMPPVRGDAESLRSVFTNLIINGVQAMETSEQAGGRLTVTLEANGDGQARVRIVDTGRGIAPDHLAQIFEPYFSTKETGTGLGLAIAKKAVEDHEGTLSVASTPGAGTTFTVTLPTTERGQRSEVRGQ